jgi:nucleoside-diphosphate-sugar epimerase
VNGPALSSSRVGLLGASDALGHDLLPHLRAVAKDVVVLLEPLRSLPTERAAADVEIRFADVTQPEDLTHRLRGLDIVINAAEAPYPVDRHERHMWSVNAIGAHNVARAAVEAGAEALLHVSSSAAVGYPPDALTADEDFDFANSVTTSAYALTKRHGEDLVRAAARDDLHLVIVNPATVLSTTGRDDLGWAPLLRRLARAPVVPTPPGGSGFCTPGDLADVAVAALSSGEHGRRYLVVSENLTFTELFGRLDANRDKAHRPLRLSDAACRAVGVMAAAGAVLPDRRRPMIDRVATELMTRRLFYSADRAAAELGFRPSTVDEALHRLLTANGTS